ncbi:DUF1064 domain-containing protein [Paenibacillus sp. CAU 1782]
MSKYNNKKVVVTADGTIFTVSDIVKYNLSIEGIPFDSEMEANYYQELLSLQREGTVLDIECQPKFVLQDKPKIVYIADFRVTFATGEQVIIDVKGVETSTFSVKKRLFKARFPEFRLQIITRYRGVWMPTKDARKQQVQNKKARKALLDRFEHQQKGRGI